MSLNGAGVGAARCHRAAAAEDRGNTHPQTITLTSKYSYLYNQYPFTNDPTAGLLHPDWWITECSCVPAFTTPPPTIPIPFRPMHFYDEQRVQFNIPAAFQSPAHILAHAPLGRPAIYMRANTAVPLWPEMNYVGQHEADPLTFVRYPREGSGASTLYEDQGDGHEYLNGFYARRSITCEVESGNIRIVIGAREGAFVPARQRIRLELREIAAEPKAIHAGEAAAWRYDSEQWRLIVDLLEAASARVINLSME